MPKASQQCTSLTDKSVIVTGAGRGIGKSIALAFAAAGSNVACVARTRHQLDAVVSQAQEHAGCQGECFAIEADIAAPNAARDIYSETIQHFGRVDILVNNAAISKISPFANELDFQSWWRVLEVNLKGPAALIHQVLPEMIRRHSGTIISLGSRNAAVDFPFMTAYSTSKTGLMRLHQCLQLELSNTGVHNYVIQPGDVPTSLAHEEGVINVKAVEELPVLRRMLEGTVGSSNTSPNLAADLCLCLCISEDAKLLSGLYVNVEKDYRRMVLDLQNRSDSKIRSHSLNKLKLEEL